VPAKRPARRRTDRPSAVNRRAGGIDGAAQECLANSNHSGLSFCAHDRTGLQQGSIPQHHHQAETVTKSDDLGTWMIGRVMGGNTRLNAADGTDGDRQAGYFDQAAVA
jgi:hypothetical protein